MVEEANKELDVKLTSCELGHEMLKLLPPLSQACQLCETFLEFGKFASVMLTPCMFYRILIVSQLVSIISRMPLRRGYQECLQPIAVRRLMLCQRVCDAYRRGQ